MVSYITETAVELSMLFRAQKMARGVHTACAADNAHRYENTHCFSFVVVVVAQAGVAHTNGKGIFSLVYDVSFKSMPIVYRIASQKVINAIAVLKGPLVRDDEKPSALLIFKDDDYW